jgi:hypothetical protein
MATAQDREMDTGSPTDVAAGSYAGVLQAAAMAALEWSIDDRPAVPDSEALAALATFDEALSETGLGVRCGPTQ